MQGFTFNHQIFTEAVESLNTGTWSAEQTTVWVQKAYDYVNHEADEILSLLDETGYYDESPQEVEQGLNGLESYQLALEHLWDYLENGFPEDLEQAVLAASEAHQHLQKAVEINLEMADALEYSALG